MRSRIYIKSVVIILSLLYPLLSNAQIHSFIRHYGRNMGIAGQTWNVHAADNDFVFFANGENIHACHNGVFTPQPFKTEVRSVYAPPNSSRIYAGGINECGYFDVSNSG